jgi:UDP-N-acetylmuramyl pentapeptide phosphotransferase/UDP-N-acetylglucosamine-1-phosphate transferase
MLLLVYPIFETLYSMYRRKVVGGLSPGEPDRMHLHQVIYKRLAPDGAEGSDHASITRYNNKVAPFGWLMTAFCALPAVFLWRNTWWLVGVSLIFCVGYLVLYRQMLRPRDQSVPKPF